MMTDKSLLRAEMKSHRAVLAQADPTAGDRLTHMADIDAAGVVAGYWPIQSELSPLPFMQKLSEQGCALALPCLIPAEGGGYVMAFRAFELGDHLEFGPYGISQPDADKPMILPDVVLVPLLAFDRRGGRLGYGGGFYDRALDFLKSQKEIKAWGIGFAGQELDEVPLEPHDQRLDLILTEAGAIHI
ncbi:5-formyltetrahydrofolate cyclo-ligase [Asticcacaulis sp. ZE23SCel15]|uniref:5-formyltetrahydrofolate cyclo-ligase n=1 Tax=Asticcacaulis sp. ZE23SCel15 TaxID=3059027 RepID=UPI00265E8209|nr:5-formyltetrahydrofolate cyclo-ligase [Asticcacaulis sp. ZE23SCel15]WKL55845.1 5-formyltetrahydrofolate cyclo-ligase [Asticcacaulis sp. ZE23SCel15]